MSTETDMNELINVIDDLHTAALDAGSNAADRLLQVLGYDDDTLPSGAALRGRLREVLA